MSVAPASPLAPGHRLDRYELLCPIADGGMAQVWLARLRGKHGFEKLVAIKTILPKFATDPQFQKMFLDEARIASGIQHANVAQILDLGDEQGVLYIALEWVDGDALTKLHRTAAKNGEAIPVDVLLRIVADTCDGLHAAHELRGKDGTLLGVVHRDVSPHNVLVDVRGDAKLIDFGIAKARDRSVDETGTGTLKGKIHYMAPEQAVGSAIDRRADIWAVGAILYHYLSGRPPFDGPNQVATLHQLTHGTPPPPLPARVPAAVAVVVMRALAHDPARRHETAAHLKAALEDAMLSSGLAASTDDVAAFARKHLAERSAKRKADIDAALAAAAERDRPREPGEVGPVRWLSPEDKAAPSVGTAATAGLESSITPSRGVHRRHALIALVGVVGIGLGIGASVVLRADGDSHASSATLPAATRVLPSVETPPPAAPATASASSQPMPSEAAVPGASAPPVVPPPGRALPTANAPLRPSRPAASPKLPRVIDNGF